MDQEKTVNGKGKAKAKFKRVPDGPHTVEVLECNLPREVNCE